MTKEEIINTVEVMGFRLDYDQYDQVGYSWMRFKLANEELEEKNLRVTWYRNKTTMQNFAEVAQVLFKAGQKSKIQEFEKNAEKFKQLTNLP